MRVAAPLSVSLLMLLLQGCHSHYIQTTITNTGSASVNVIQVEYPSASFGVQQLLPGAAFHYRFKLLGSGPIKLSFIDAKNLEHKQTGPQLNEGQEGTLTIAIANQSHANFTTSLRP